MDRCYWEKELNYLLREIIERKKMELHAERQDNRDAISCFKSLRSCKGVLMSLYRSITNTPVRSVWLGTNVTLELSFFLRKFLANCLSWNKCMFFLVWMMRVSLKHFINKFVNEWKHINWLNKVDITTFKGRFGSQMFLPVWITTIFVTQKLRVEVLFLKI